MTMTRESASEAYEPERSIQAQGVGVYSETLDENGWKALANSGSSAADNAALEKEGFPNLALVDSSRGRQQGQSDSGFLAPLKTYHGGTHSNGGAGNQEILDEEMQGEKTGRTTRVPIWPDYNTPELARQWYAEYQENR